jgi:hypothetical protein
MSAEVPEHRKPWAIYEKELPDYWDATKVPSATGAIAWQFGGPPDLPAVWVAMDRGSKIHAMLHFLDERDLHWPSIAGTELERYAAAWREWLQPTDEFVAIEKPLWGTIAGVNYIVRPDRVIRRRGKIMVVDLKTKSRVGRPPTEQEQRQHALEVAAQKVAIAQRLGPDADWVGCAYLWPDKIKLVQYGDARDVDQFGDILARWADAQKIQATG